MMTKHFSGAASEADEYRLFTLRNANDMVVTVSERGAALWAWRAPDRYGRMADVLQAPGRSAGMALWQGRHADGGVQLLRMGDGDALAQMTRFRLDDDGSLTVEHEVVAMALAPLETASNPCFNLNGGMADVGDHMLQIDADYYVEADANGAPAGVAAVAGTAFDFRQPAPIGARLRWPDSQLVGRAGFDHCFFVRDHFAGGQGPLRKVARVVDPGSGRCLQVYTTEAAMQFCAGPLGGFTLEARSRPELASAAWPNMMVLPGQVYRQTSVYRLSLDA
ncbi:galactose-1-epimerase [Duganella sp. Root336D2]|uniref:aldose epimerase family protein n=1 Tax=Duganella sp. Root336D2 TaxID=1736518 RepID=UPI000A9F47AC|nr:galactose-1-epimerase [Duganella sp. Root336D2]